MKNLKQNYFTSEWKKIALSVLILLPYCLYAQPVIYPSKLDLSTLSVPGMFNSAMINYGAGITSSPQKAIFGIAWQATGSLIYVQDVFTGTTATIVPPPHGTISVPDVIIGNSATSGNFVMAVAYCYSYGFTMQVEVDFYEISGAGGALSIAPPTSQYFNLLSPYAGNTVHLDIIADHHVSPSPALPKCQRFLLTFDDPAFNQIYVSNGDVSLHYLSTGAVALPPSGTQPDIAAIQRFVSGSYDDIGLITYIDNVTGDVMYTEFDYSHPTAWTLTHMDLASAGYSFAMPRIDADDNFNTNTLGGKAHYEIAAQAYNTTSGNYEVHTCNNILGAGSFFASANGLVISGLTPPYNHYSPVVAQTSSTGFGVFHYTDLSAGPIYATFLDPIVASSPSSVLNYYWVSALSASAAVIINGISISSSCNFNFLPNGLSLYAWSETDPPAPPMTYYKLSSSTYAFREGTAPNSVSNIGEQKCGIFPNPARDIVTFKNGDGNATASSFQVVNMAGISVIKGEITGTSTGIDIQQLPAGNYVIEAFNEDKIVANLRFVKK